MTPLKLTFDAIDEAAPGPKWAARWARSWPAYEAWFRARSGDSSPLDLFAGAAPVLSGAGARPLPLPT